MTHNHIRNGKVPDGKTRGLESCTLELALREHGFKDAIVGSTFASWHVGDKPILWPLPERLRRFVLDMDNNIPVSPFTFTVPNDTAPL